MPEEDLPIQQQTGETMQDNSSNVSAGANLGQSGDIGNPPTDRLSTQQSENNQTIPPPINSNINSIYPNPSISDDTSSQTLNNNGEIGDSTKKKSPVIIILLITILLIGGAGYYLFIFKNKVTRKIDKLCLVTDKTNGMIPNKYFLTEHNIGKFNCTYNFSIEKSGTVGGVDMVGFYQDYNTKYTTYDSKIKEYQQQNSSQKTSLVKEFEYDGHKGAIYKTEFVTNSSPSGLQLFYDQPNGVVNIVTYEKSFSASQLIKLLKTLDFDYGYQASKSTPTTSSPVPAVPVAQTQTNQNAVTPCDGKGEWQNITITYSKTISTSGTFVVSIPKDFTDSASANFAGAKSNNFMATCSKDHSSHFTSIGFSAKHAKNTSVYDYQIQSEKQYHPDAKATTINLNNPKISRQYSTSPYDNLNKVYTLSVISELKINGEYYLTTLNTGDIAFKTQDLEVYNRFINSIK